LDDSATTFALGTVQNRSGHPGNGTKGEQVWLSKKSSNLGGMGFHEGEKDKTTINGWRRDLGKGRK